MTSKSHGAWDGDDANESTVQRPPSGRIEQSAYVLCVAGAGVGRAVRLGDGETTIGRAPGSTVLVLDQGVSRLHASILRVGAGFAIQDADSANGTFVNGERAVNLVPLADGDLIQIADTTFKFCAFAPPSAQQQRVPEQPPQSRIRPWSVDSWREMPVAHDVQYDDPAATERVVEKLRRLPPLVTSWEVEELKELLAEAQEGRRFVLQGGDCAETLADCDPTIITNKLKILIQMSLVLIRGARRPVVRIGRFAGQYAKPRSSPTETRDGVELPSYFGDLINRPEFTPEARRPNPELLLAGYYHAGLTLNFIRALSVGGFSDLRRPEYFDLSYFERAELPTNIRTDYARMCREVTDGLDFLRSVGDRAMNELMKVNFYTSHEGLNLLYESSQTRQVPRRDGCYDLTTHMPWIGERTRQLSGAHIEFFRGIANPVAVKIGPTIAPDELVALCKALNPMNAPGKLALVTRLGAKQVSEVLPPLVSAVKNARQRVLWISDPMHGNAIRARSGIKTRDFEDILREIELSITVHERLDSYLGGVHFELTGENVTECIGGGLTEEDLTENYSTTCDPRLNYRQAIQMALSLARRLSDAPRAPSTMPPPGYKLP